MKHAIVIAALGSLVAFGCTNIEATPANTSDSVTRSAAPPWRRNLFPTEGITVDMPGIAEEGYAGTAIEKDRELTYHHIGYTTDDGNRRYEAGLYYVSEPQNRTPVAEILDAVRAMIPQIQQQTHSTAQGLEGVAIRGTTSDGKSVDLRAYTVGAYLCVLRTIGAPSASMSADTERFFQSFRYRMPFRVFAVPDDYVTIAAPSNARFSRTASKIPKTDGLLSKTYFFGLEKNDWFSLSIIQLPPNVDDEAADEFTDNMTTQIARKEGVVIERKVALVVDGAPARDIIIKTAKGTFERDLLVVKNRRAYFAVREHPEMSTLSDATSTTFFTSLTIGRAP